MPKAPEAATHIEYRAWWLAGAVLLALVVGQLVLYSDTSLSIVRIWSRSDTYAHGWIIAPISLYLVWVRWHELRQLMPRPSVIGALVWAALNVVWLIGHLAGTLVVAQYALVAMIPALVWSVLGSRVAWSIAFSLIFLLLAVPSGEAMVPTLMEFTADFTVKALLITGIPVFREGMYFSVPTGDWSVVEACSGIRYLIASFTGGCLFAYLYYRTAWKRLTLILASVLVPIVGNGIRAYLIVMIGHLSNMRLAVGVDHVIFGWVFFGVLMFGMFWVASLWREGDEAGSTLSRAVPEDGNTSRSGQILVMALALSVAAGAWRAYAARLSPDPATLPEVVLAQVPGVQPWTEGANPVTRWEPYFAGYDKSVSQSYARGMDKVQLRILYYRGQSEGRELISSMNKMNSAAESHWRAVGDRALTELDGRVPLREVELRGGTGEYLLVWQWYVVDGRAFTNPFLGKFLLAIDRMRGRTGEGAAVFVMTPHEAQPARARETLRAFVTALNPGILTTLAQTKGR